MTKKIGNNCSTIDHHFLSYWNVLCDFQLIGQYNTQRDDIARYRHILDLLHQPSNHIVGIWNM